MSIRQHTILIFLLFIMHMGAMAQKVLLFVSHEDTYYSEYIVMKEALEAAGYTVDVRSASAQDFSIYMIPEGTDIEATANTLSGSSYTQFQQQFSALFDGTWNGTLNATPASLAVDGSILDVPNLSNYVGLVIAGGTGALDYRLDGDYASQGAGDRLLSAETIEDVAQKLNDLAVEGLIAGKPVMAQCHGASLPVFWRVPETTGAGVEALGFSLLKDGLATGYPEAETPTTLADFGVTHRAQDRVTISSPHSSLTDDGAGDFKIVTTRDWYPQTVAHAARTFVNILETYPSKASREEEVSVLIVHGGALIENDCLYTNRDNDVPCNHGTGANLPADYEDLLAMLQADDVDDDFTFNTTAIDITGTLSFTKTNLSSSLAYLNQFDVVLFYKHWSTGLTDEFLQAIYDYADDGGGVIGLHHALYNDIEGSQNKDVLVSLFGAQSSASGWSASLTNYDLHSTNYGHFISTYGVEYDLAETAPAAWDTNALPNAANTPYSYLPVIAIYDELYNNMAFEAGTSFGRETNEITPLLSNGQTPAGQAHTSAFTRLVDFDDDDQVGRVFYTQVGERTENYNSSSQYYRMIRNATVWAVGKSVPEVATWNGSSWENGSPSEAISAKIEGNYTGVGFTCSDLTVDEGTTLNITSGTLEVKGDVTNNGAILISSGAAIITYSSESYYGNDLKIQRNTRYDDGRYSFVGSPVAQNSGNTASDLGAHVYTYDEGQSATTEALSRWIPQAAGAELISGRGYTQANQQMISFEGKPNSGTITYTGSYVNDGWHLVSNPYGAAILLDDFLDANLNTTGAIYIWDDNDSEASRGTNDDYIVANKTGAVDVHATSGVGPNSEARWNGHIGSAQAFFVQLNSSAGTITFEEAMRRAGNNEDDHFFRKNEDSDARLLIGLSYDGLAKQTLIGWNNEVSNDELTIGYDAPLFNQSVENAIYSMKSGEKLTIQTVTDQTESIALGYSVMKEGQYSLNFQNETNSLSKWILYDNQLSKTHFLSDGAYAFDSKAGSFEVRFSLKKASAVLATLDRDSMMYVFGKTLFIKGVDARSGVVTLYDLSGHRAFHQAYSQDTQIDLSHLSTGVYVITDGVSTRKVILK